MLIIARTLAEKLRRAQTILDRPVLAELPLAFDAVDREADADDGAEVGGDVVVRGVVDLPRDGLGGGVFGLVGEADQVGAQTHGVVMVSTRP